MFKRPRAIKVQLRDEHDSTVTIEVRLHDSAKRSELTECLDQAHAQAQAQIDVLFGWQQS